MVKHVNLGHKPAKPTSHRMRVLWLLILTVGILSAAGWMFAQPEAAPSAGGEEATVSIPLFAPILSNTFAWYEKVLLIANVFIAIAGLIYALTLVKQVKEAPQGTPRMQEIAHAVREGANAYLYRQFRVVFVLIILITILLYYGATLSHAPASIAIGRAIAFLVGSTFSAMVGFFGMRMATVGNLRVATAAQTSFGQALQLGYRTGTITGMLTDGLGLLGGSIIFSSTANTHMKPCWDSVSAARFWPCSCVSAEVFTPRRLTWRGPGGQTRGRHSRGRSPQCRHHRR